MKTEKEIREHRDALTLLMAQPCNCAKIGPTHEYRCAVGGVAMQASIRSLSWALGEEPRVEAAVSEMSRAAAELRKEKKT